MEVVSLPLLLVVAPSRRNRSRRPKAKVRRGPQSPRTVRALRPLDPGRPLDRVRLLAIDDDRDTRDLLRLMLEPLGATVRVAEDGEAALILLQSYQPHLILVDLMMPGMDGLAFARVVRGHPKWSRIPLLAVTALAGLADYISTWTIGFAGHLTKPVEQEELVKSIRRLLPAAGGSHLLAREHPPSA
jgi:CheY-like chemotaxis protein